MVQEVEDAIKQLALNKASGPDGLPNEFLKKFWLDLKSEIMQILHGFHDCSLDLRSMNKANVVMVPKIDSPQLVGDFRPISIINLIPKFISKILSNRLRLKMPGLISERQTAFIRGRQIADNFVATREVLQHIRQSGKPAVFLKLDFAKAFDTIE